MVDGNFRRAMETQGDWNFECRIRRADGQVRWIWAAGRHHQDAQEPRAAWRGSSRTSPIASGPREALRESEQLLPLLVGESIDYGCCWVCDPEGRNIYG